MVGYKYGTNEKEMKAIEIIVKGLLGTSPMVGELFSHFPFLRYICPNYCGYNGYVNINGKLATFIKKTVDEMKATYKSEMTRGFFDSYLHVLNSDEKAESFSEDQLVAIGLDFIFAGYETTSKIISLAFLLMLLHPDIQKEAQEKMDKCDKTFTTKDRFWKHKSYTHNIKPWHPCKICGKLFRNLSLATYHEKVHSTGEKFECDICLKALKHSKSLYQHKKMMHNNSKKFRCEECNKTFTSKAHLQYHNGNVHLGVKFKCPDCKKSYTKESYFKIHRRTHLSDYVPVTYICYLCDDKFTAKQSMKRHISAHRLDPQFVCDTCGKRIRSAESLKKHLRIHSGEKPFKCKDCVKAFSTKQFLTAHERVHTKEKPYCCNLCLKHFTQRSSLTVHLRQHTGERPYMCKICRKKFTSSTNLNSHMKVHNYVPRKV
ncbi:hypothetical protein RI129_011405 [Pyrocoelia pectoralis]|uniref:C2H2-type domain-containing protein n=1 Tax=Pyrocoelia pectoralis TaxID=417401 RepID=A0AAN7VBY2_9COLE